MQLAAVVAVKSDILLSRFIKSLGAKLSKEYRSFQQKGRHMVRFKDFRLVWKSLRTHRGVKVECKFY